jgi:NADH-quinone oxidoreductase subunit J
MGDLLFYALCLGMLGCAAVVVTSRNLFRSVLAFAGVILGAAVLFFALGAEMTALAQIMVYIGGVMIFVLYAVFLTAGADAGMPAPSRAKILFALLVAAAPLVLLGGLALRSSGDSPYPGDGLRTPIASLESLGLRLLNPGADGFLIPFELVSVLLLAAMAGAIAVASREKGES